MLWLLFLLLCYGYSSFLFEGVTEDVLLWQMCTPTSTEQLKIMVWLWMGWTYSHSLRVAFGWSNLTFKLSDMTNSTPGKGKGSLLKGGFVLIIRNMFGHVAPMSVQDTNHNLR